MRFHRDALAALHVRAQRAVEDKKREERRIQKARAAEEEGAQLRILALAAVRGMEEPQRGVDANSETTVRRVQDESVVYGDVRQRAHLTRGAQHVPKTSDTHEEKKEGVRVSI